MPKPEFDELQDLLKQNSLCGPDNTQGLFFCLCDQQIYETYPDIELQIGNNLYTLPRKSYVQRTDDRCVFLIMSMDFPEGRGLWILGDNFLQNYYTIFDLETKKVGFIGSVAFQEIPWNAIDYVTLFVTTFLIAFLAYVTYESCFASNKGRGNTNGEYQELPGEHINIINKAAGNQQNYNYSLQRKSSGGSSGYFGGAGGIESMREFGGSSVISNFYINFNGQIILIEIGGTSRLQGGPNAEHSS